MAVNRGENPKDEIRRRAVERDAAVVAANTVATKAEEAENAKAKKDLRKLSAWIKTRKPKDE